MEEENSAIGRNRPRAVQMKRSVIDAKDTPGWWEMNCGRGFTDVIAYEKEAHKHVEHKRKY